MSAVSTPAGRSTSGAAVDRQSSPSPLDTGQPVLTLDAAQFRDLLKAGLAWLDRHHEIVNALNVFPVPDGDTGTNMLLTMKSACGEITEEHLHTAGAVAKAIAHGALMGARGNSGVILSQILRGIARSLDDQPTITGPSFAAALSEGSRIAYKGVNRPVEGTILTVVREAAAAAESAATLDDDLRFIMGRTVHAAADAVANTPNLLPVLAQAGKVDSGGKGLFFILEGMYRVFTGERPEAVPLPPIVQAPTPAETRPSKGVREIPPLVYGFDVQFLVEGRDLSVATIRERITAMGDCPLVEGDESLVKVHVHVTNPGVPLGYAVSLGFVTDIVVENMDDMHIPQMPRGYDPFPPRFDEGMLSQAATLPGAGSQAGSVTCPGVVAVVPGAGLAQVFRSLGTHIIVSGGQTMNPSTQDMLEAIRRLPCTEIIVLPNNGNVVMAAQQAQTMAAAEGKAVRVVPSKSIPQGICALLALNPHVDLEHNAEAMTSSLSHVQTGEVTVAVQDACFDGIQIHTGDIIGLLNDTLTATGPTPEAVVSELLAQMGAADLEVITLYYGQPVTDDEARAMQKTLLETFPQQEIEIVDGGQPFYHYIISAE